MEFLQSLIESGDIVKLALLVLAVETLILAALFVTGKSPLRPLVVFVNAGAGGSLMFALLAAVAGSGWQWIAAGLLASLLFHAADLALRWHEARSR